MNCEDMISSCISSIPVIDWTPGNISFCKESLMLGTNIYHQSWMLHPSTHLWEIWTTFGKAWALKASLSAHHHSRFDLVIQICDLPIPRATSSSAVADRPRDASCLSVVRVSSTIPRAPSVIMCYFGFRFTAENTDCIIVRFRCSIIWLGCGGCHSAIIWSQGFHQTSLTLWAYRSLMSATTVTCDVVLWWVLIDSYKRNQNIFVNINITSTSFVTVVLDWIKCVSVHYSCEKSMRLLMHWCLEKESRYCFSEETSIWIWFCKLFKRWWSVAALAMGLRGSSPPRFCSSPPRFLYKVMLCDNYH